MTMNWRAVAKTACIMTGVTIALLALVEGGVRVWERWHPANAFDFDMGFMESRLFVPAPDDPEKMVTNPARCKAFREQTFKRKKPAGTMRIIALGGSSVNFLGPDLAGLLQRLPRLVPTGYTAFETINAGGLAYGSQRLVLLTAELLQYEPDLILLYSGHNEFEEVEQLDLANLRVVPLQKTLNHLATFRVLRDIKTAWMMRRLTSVHNRAITANPDVDYTASWRHQFTPEEVQERMRAYERNLTMIAQMCQERGVPLIIGTVPSNLLQPKLTVQQAVMFEEAKSLYEKGDYQQGMAITRKLLRDIPRHQSSDVENEIIRKVAAAYGLPLADVEAAIISLEPHGVPGETYFNDECHLNALGRLVQMNAYETEIKKLFR